MLHISLVTPYFDLGNSVYTVAAHYQLNRLQVIQNAAARLILLAEPRTPVYELLARLGWGTLVTKATKCLVKKIYDCLQDEAPSNLYDKLKPVEHNGRVTRALAAGMLNVPASC